LDDVLVAGAPAGVALERVPDLLLSRVVELLQQRHGRHYEARRAVAALEGVVLVEGTLDMVELAVRGEAFDRRDLGAVGLHGEDGAGLDRLAVDQDRAGAAGGRVAADVRAGEPELLAEEVDEQLPRFDLRLMPRAVHGDRDLPHERGEHNSDTAPRR